MSRSTPTPSVKPIEGKHQHFDKALAARRARKNTDSFTLFTEWGTKTFLKHTPKLSMQAVMTTLLRLAGIGAMQCDRDELMEKLEKTSTADLKKASRHVLSITKRSIQLKRKAVKLNRSPESVDALNEALCPSAYARLTGAPDYLPWDAEHDGHLVTREISRALGIVRWAHAISPEMDKRLRTLFENAVYYSRRGCLNPWVSNRPLIVLGEVDDLAKGLVADLWAYHPKICVVLTQKVDENPFEALPIPVCYDPQGHLPFFLDIETTPTLIEPRLGGITLTAATGGIDTLRLETKAIPSWYRSMAEIGVLNRFQYVNHHALLGNVPPPKRALYVKRLKHLFGVKVESDWRENPGERERNFVHELRSRRQALKAEILESLEGMEA